MKNRLRGAVKAIEDAHGVTMAAPPSHPDTFYAVFPNGAELSIGYGIGHYGTNRGESEWTPLDRLAEQAMTVEVSGMRGYSPLPFPGANPDGIRGWTPLDELPGIAAELASMTFDEVD